MPFVCVCPKAFEETIVASLFVRLFACAYFLRCDIWTILSLFPASFFSGLVEYVFRWRGQSDWYHRYRIYMHLKIQSETHFNWCKCFHPTMLVPSFTTYALHSTVLTHSPKIDKASMNEIAFSIWLYRTISVENLVIAFLRERATFVQSKQFTFMFSFCVPVMPISFVII